MSLGCVGHLAGLTKAFLHTFDASTCEASLNADKK
jgi:hypothetical protein